MSFSKRDWSSAGPTRLRVPDPLSSPASPQDQSLLFEILPIEIRRHIYRQLWLDCGLTQHILALTPKAYLQSYPCVLSQEELDQEPVPAAPGDSDAASGPDANEEQDEPQPHDDPGDINGALYDLSDGDSSADRDPPNTPWCAHHACFRRWTERYGHSFSSMYSADYRSERSRPDLRASVVLTAFLVCRRVYQEAGESLYSSVRFSFASLMVMKMFVGQVPRPLMSRIQFADIVAANLGILPHAGPVDNRTPAQQVYETCKESFPNLRELRLTLHPRHGSGVIPGRHALEPLCALARDMDTRLSRFEVFLPTRCDGKSELGYGEAPLSLRGDVPFTVKVVPPGFHEASGCTPFDCPTRSLQD